MVTSMAGNQVVSTMFDFNTCNHMVRFLLWAMRLKTLDIVLSDPGCDGVCIIRDT
jgi:hypothetical protein